MLWRPIAAISAVFLLYPTVRAGAPQESVRPNVILVTIDTLRADYLGCYGNSRIETPAIDSLAADGALFERAYCQVPMTPPSHASILTGTYPPTHGVRDFTSPGLPRGFPTLAGTLKKNGYSTAAFVSAYVLDSVWGLNQGFDTYDDQFEAREFVGVNPGNVQRRAGKTIDLALNWLKRPGRRPYFLWVHLFDPHHDYAPPEPFRTRYARDLYAGEVAYADRELGRLVNALRRNGDYEKSLIVVTSDHGEAFGEHEESEHGFFLYNTTLHIPLIIKLPGSRPARIKISGIVETVDIAPTVLQITRVPADKSTVMQGVGLLSQIAGKPGSAQRASYAETLYPETTFGWSPLVSLTQGRYKYIEAPRPELYDLAADPEEKANLCEAQRAVAGPLRRQLDQLRQRLRAGAQKNPAPTTDPQRLESLRALGYVAVAAPSGHRRDGKLPDPKDKVKVFNKILLGLQASEAGALERSNNLFSEVLLKEPDLFIVQYSLGLNRLKGGQASRALEHFERAKDLNPGFDLIDINRALALSQLGRLEEGISILLEVLKHNPSRLPAKKQLALLYTRKRDFPRAVQVYKDIRSGRPQDANVTKLLGIAQAEAQQYPDAIESLTKAITPGPEDAVVRNYLGIALANTGRLQEAAASHRKALEIKPDYHQARLNLSFALLKLGQVDEARREFAILCRAAPPLCDQYRKYFLATEPRSN